MIVARPQINITTDRDNPLADETLEAINEFVTQYLENAAEYIQQRIQQDFSIKVRVEVSD